MVAQDRPIGVRPPEALSCRCAEATIGYRVCRIKSAASSSITSNLQGGSGMSALNTLRLTFVYATFSLLCAQALAQDTAEARRAAADRYLRVVPMAKMLDDTFAEISKQAPPDQRARFLSDMKRVVRVEVLEALSRESMVKTFTTDELNALADFYGSQHGSGAMLKLGAYMGLIMPAIQAEVQRGMQELQEQKKQQPRPL
ncbi:MAG: hypothetical protein HEQ39_11740 [Rhizobacter sp.]